MRVFKTVLSGKGLLAASVAMLSTSALAETAGRVSFVSGTVTASLPDGSSRQLQKGDVINGGDRISTLAGRIQIRFSDGGFVSLQPNTVFGVDEYLYSNRKPEETSLFFSLLQGGMRTITGAIGKVNKQSYKVRTPVATIGIRGTGYRASLTPHGLIVSVGSGFVNVANDQGEVTGGAGQNISVPDAASTPALGDEQADLQASGINGDQGHDNEGLNQDNSAGDTPAVGNVQSANGDYIFLFTTDGRPLQSSDLAKGSPRYYFSSPGYGNSSNSGLGILATFDGSGAPIKAYTASNNANPLAPDFDSGTLKFVNVKTTGGLSWGEMTDGSSATNAIFSTCGANACYAPVSLSSTQFTPYIVGLAPVSNLASGTATYTLQGGTSPRSSAGTVGTLDSFRITVSLDFATVDLDMKVTMPVSVSPTAPANTYHVSTANSLPVGYYNLGTAGEFFLDSSFLKVTDSSGSCAASTGLCNASINGFFVGTGAAQIGSSYSINNNSSNETITGVAALGLSSYSGTPATAPNGAGYSLAYANAGNPTSPGGVGFMGGYNTGPTSDYSLTNTFDSQGLASASGSLSGQSLVRTSASATDTGRSGNLNWGRWTAGDVSINGSTVTLGSNDSLHYITGPMTQPNIFLAFTPGATATYALSGGTTATGNDGSTGTLSSNSKALVTFNAIPTVAIDLDIAMKNSGGASIGNYTLSTITPVSNLGRTTAPPSADFVASGISIGGTACGSAGACSGSISGFFAGQQAQQIGLGYHISDLSRAVDGAAAFTRGAITAPVP